MKMGDNRSGAIFPSDDYRTGLSRLWGADTVKQLRGYVDQGDIEGHHIRSMADRMGTKRIYDENIKLRGMDLVVTFDRMLEKFYDETLFDKHPDLAKDILVKLLEDAGCSRRFVTGIQRMSDSYRQ